MALVETSPGHFTVTGGSFDTDHGIHITVAGDAFPRVSVTAAGVAVGDGTAAPFVPASAPDVAAEADGDYLVVVTVTDGVATTALADAADYVNA